MPHKKAKMNYKLLFPSYRNRYTWIENTLSELRQTYSFEKALNLGCGEGEMDSMLAKYVGHLWACDINKDDLVHAKTLNQPVKNITYSVDDALATPFEDSSFDFIISSEVIEHVADSEKLMQEIARLLKPNGIALITYPTEDFPITYDPIHHIAAYFGRKKILPIGAYAFGHDKIINTPIFKNWCEKYHFNILKDSDLSGYLICLLEMYWTGIAHSLVKKNAKNLSAEHNTSFGIRPHHKVPKMSFLADIIINIDRRFFLKKDVSFLKGFVLKFLP